MTNFNRVVNKVHKDWFFGGETSAVFSDVQYINGKFFALAANNSCFTSQDGKNWHENFLYGTKSVAYGNGRYVSVGHSSVSISSDGESWKSVSRPVSKELITKGFFTNNHHVLVGEEIVTSNNGTEWEARRSRENNDYVFHEQYKDVSFGNNRYVAVGTAGESMKGKGIIAISADGNNWKVQETGKAPLASVTFGKGLFVAVGQNGLVLTSKDCRNWQDKSIAASTHLMNVTYGNGVFVALGDTSTNMIEVSSEKKSYTSEHVQGDGVVLVSADGKQWKERYRLPKAFLRGITFGENGFVVVCDGGKVLHSKNGKEWKSTPIEGLGDNMFGGVTYGGGYYLASVFSKGIFYVSRTGEEWTKKEIKMKGVVYSTGQRNTV
jgi:hypothetical protein